MNVDEFIAHIETCTPAERDRIIQRGKALRGKFALLARILEGDESATLELQHLVDTGQVAPNRDLTTQYN